MRIKSWHWKRRQWQAIEQAVIFKRLWRCWLLCDRSMVTQTSDRPTAQSDRSHARRFIVYGSPEPGSTKKIAVMLNEAKTSSLRPTIIIMKKVPNNDWQHMIIAGKITKSRILHDFCTKNTRLHNKTTRSRPGRGQSLEDLTSLKDRWRTSVGRA